MQEGPVTDLTLRLRPVTMHQFCLEAGFCYALLHKGHGLDPIGKDEDLWGIALPQCSFLQGVMSSKLSIQLAEASPSSGT